MSKTEKCQDRQKDTKYKVIIIKICIKKLKKKTSKSIVCNLKKSKMR